MDTLHQYENSAGFEFVTLYSFQPFVVTDTLVAAAVQEPSGD